MKGSVQWKAPSQERGLIFVKFPSTTSVLSHYNYFKGKETNRHESIDRYPNQHYVAAHYVRSLCKSNSKLLQSIESDSSCWEPPWRCWIEWLSWQLCWLSSARFRWRRCISHLLHIKQLVYRFYSRDYGRSHTSMKVKRNLQRRIPVIHRLLNLHKLDLLHTLKLCLVVSIVATQSLCEIIKAYVWFWCFG